MNHIKFNKIKMKGYVKNVDMEIVKMDYFQMGNVHVMLVGLQMEH